MAFATATAVLMHLHRRARRAAAAAAAARSSLLEAIELAALLVLTGAVCFARVYLGYHSLEQVAAGAALGAAFAWAWHRLALAAHKGGAFAAAAAALAGLHVRDTLGEGYMHARAKAA
jgi:dolichyldiphosphatase